MALSNTQSLMAGDTQAGTTIAGVSDPNAIEPTAKEKEEQKSVAGNMVKNFSLLAIQANTRIGGNLAPPNYGMTAAPSNNTQSPPEKNDDETKAEPEKRSDGTKMKIGKRKDGKDKIDGGKKISDGKGIEKAASKVTPEDTPKTRPNPQAAGPNPDPAESVADDVISRYEKGEIDFTEMTNISNSYGMEDNQKLNEYIAGRLY